MFGFIHRLLDLPKAAAYWITNLRVNVAPVLRALSQDVLCPSLIVRVQIRNNNKMKYPCNALNILFRYFKSQL